jgi:glycosyltransferase involved in cell wall biosynthesis
MTQHYLFYTPNTLPKPNVASLVQVNHSANAAANLGYSTVLAYYRQGWTTLSPLEWLNPFRPQAADTELVNFYNLQDRLQVAALPLPWPIGHYPSKWTSPNTLVSKFYFPVFIRPVTKLVHTRDWNFAKTAIKFGVPVIYEQHHYHERKFPAEIVQNPLFQIAVTVIDTVRDDMIRQGMPPEKVVTIPNGFNSAFINRYGEPAAAWRSQLLTADQSHLVVYAGGLYPFKGVDLLIDVAQALPQVQFALAGGDEAAIAHYQALAQAKQVSNVVFLGYLPQSQLAGLLQAADVLAHPHLTGAAATYTSPLKLFDYLAAGTPIAASKIESLHPYQSLSLAMEWCEPNEPHHFVECLERAFTNYPRQPDGYRQNVDYVSQFSWESRITKILSYVQEELRPVRQF